MSRVQYIRDIPVTRCTLLIRITWYSWDKHALILASFCSAPCAWSARRRARLGLGSMVRPSDYANYHGRFPPTAEIWAAVRPRTSSTTPFSDLEWTLNLPPTPDSLVRPPSHQLAHRRHAATSVVYQTPEHESRPGSPPKSLRVRSTEEPPRVWSPATKWPAYNVCNPAQRSLSTVWGTSAADKNGCGWHSRPVSSRLNRSAAVFGSMRWDSAEVASPVPQSPPGSPGLTSTASSIEGLPVRLFYRPRRDKKSSRSPFLQAL